MTDAVRLALAGAFGLVVGSFLNVVIWRLPRGESLVTPRSRCPGCAAPISWYDNVPLLSWLLLRGRCRGCGTGISARYPLVEACTAGLFVLAAWRWPHDLGTVAVVSVALAALLAISFIDWEHKIIPDRITKPGIAIALVLAPLTQLHPPDWVAGLKPALSAWLHAGAGVLVGAGIILAVRFLGTLIFRKEAMGLGDVKLLAFIGALTGPLEVLYTLVLASLTGAVFGIGRLLWSRSRPSKIPVEVEGAGGRETFDRVRLGRDSIEVVAGRPAEEGDAVTVRLRLPAAMILEDEDAAVVVKGRVEAVRGVGGTHAWRIALSDLCPADRERLDMAAAAWRYVPFGPFLALGGAATLLFGDRVHWWITEGYPAFARGLLG